jgi:hypothetical protein
MMSIVIEGIFDALDAVSAEAMFTPPTSSSSPVRGAGGDAELAPLRLFRRADVDTPWRVHASLNHSERSRVKKGAANLTCLRPEMRVNPMI